SEMWYETAFLLGKFKAMEAIDTLIEHLDYNNGTVGLSAGHFPAMKELMDIGAPAVPSLVRVLFDGSRPSIRICAARALAAIADKVAKEALERALKTEVNEQVIPWIQIELQHLYSK